MNAPLNTTLARVTQRIVERSRGLRDRLVWSGCGGMLGEPAQPLLGHDLRGSGSARHVVRERASKHLVGTGTDG